MIDVKNLREGPHHIIPLVGMRNGMTLLIRSQVHWMRKLYPLKILPLKDADFSLVELRDDGGVGRLTPHCKKHGAMNKLTPTGIWRCVTTYRRYIDERGNQRFKENDCLAGCQEEQ